jgi:hypothetical protein
MELNEQEKERIAAEEKYRMEIRKEVLKEHFGGWNRCGHGGGYYGYGCHCHRGGWFKLVFLGLAIFALCHWCHHSYNGACGYGSNPPAASAPAAPAPSKN